MRAVFSAWSCRATACCSVIVIGGMTAADAAPADPPAQSSSVVVTNVLQVRRLASRGRDVSYSFRLEGNVWWANPAQGRLVLQDESGAEELEMDLQGRIPAPGERVRLEGNGTIAERGAGFRLGVKGPVVDNNGVHGMIEKGGAVYLKGGRHAIRVEWFNGVEKYGLVVEYQGPTVPRQRIPDSVLFRTAAGPKGGGEDRANGLDYRACEVEGEVLPDFSRLPAIKSGTVPNFDISVADGKEHVGVQFTGYLEVPQEGFYTFYTTSDDGSRLFIGEPTLQAQVLGPGAFPNPRPMAIGQILHEGEGGLWAKLEGKVTLIRKQPDGLRMELSGGGGRLRVEVADDSGLSAMNLMNSRIQAVGFCQSAWTTEGERVPGILLVPGAREIHFIKSPPQVFENVSTNVGALPTLTLASEVHQLKREQAQRGYPVQIRGTVTSYLPEHQAFVIQDSTRGLYVVDFSSSRSVQPQIGESLEVRGTTDPHLFAPVVNALQVRCLGAGRLPDPIQPTWDQLLNGSCDAQYVEIQGIITAVLTNGVTLRTRGGVINVLLRVTGMKTEELRPYEDALVRVRGCLFASWDYATHQVKVGEIRIYDADVIVDQPAPADLFSSPSKTPAELLLFDPHAGVFERVKVSGQIVYVRDPEYFIMRGGSGLRFIVKQPAGLQAGDQVDVVGFPELLDIGSPVLREAVARKTGHGPLPEAKRLQAGDLMHAGYDSTRVRVEGLLVSVRRTGGDEVLEMQNGVRSFIARLTGSSEPAPSLDLRSRLELTGVYFGQGGNRVAGQDFTTFELLLHSPADIRVLARPPWWTLERLLVIVGALACVLAATVLWITQLHRQVEERTAQLSEQIRERQRVENQRAMEQERARIAQDLHDELGSGITEITMLSARAKSASVSDEKRNRYLEQAGDKSREMVSALDEIVWAMNPRHDSLASLVSYFSLYAERFLGLANIAWHLEGPDESTDCAVDSRHRHQLFLAFKESLTNVVRHSSATEVRLSIQVEQGQVRLTIADNGCGLPSDARTDEMNGVANMRDRIEKLGGRFEMASRAGQGTVVRLSVPLM